MKGRFYEINSHWTCISQHRNKYNWPSSVSPIQASWLVTTLSAEQRLPLSKWHSEHLWYWFYLVFFDKNFCVWLNRSFHSFFSIHFSSVSHHLDKIEMTTEMDQSISCFSQHNGLELPQSVVSTEYGNNGIILVLLSCGKPYLRSKTVFTAWSVKQLPQSQNIDVTSRKKLKNFTNWFDDFGRNEINSVKMYE